MSARLASKMLRNHGGHLSVPEINSPGDESPRSAGITASDETDSEFGVSISATAASITKSVLLRKKKETFEKMKSSVNKSLIQPPHLSNDRMDTKSRPRSKLFQSIEKDYSINEENIESVQKSSHPIQHSVSLTTSSGFATSLSPSSPLSLLSPESDAYGNVNIIDDSGFQFAKSTVRRRNNNTAIDNITDQTTLSTGASNSRSQAFQNNMFSYLSLSSEDDTTLPSGESATPETDREIAHRLALDTAPENEVLVIEEVVDQVNRSGNNDASYENVPLRISNVGPPFLSRSRSRSSPRGGHNTLTVPRSLRHRRSSPSSDKKYVGIKSTDGTDDFSNFSSDDESETLSSTPSASGLQRRSRIRSKGSQRRIPNSTTSPLSNKKLLTVTQLTNEPLFKLLNIEFAHLVEAFLLIAPLAYAVHIRRRDVDFYSVIDALDYEIPFSRNDEKSYSLPMLFFHARNSIVYDFKFLFGYILLFLTLFIGVFQAVRLSYLVSLISMRKVGDGKNLAKFTIKHYAVSTFNAFFPEILYTGVLPPLLALATNPQHLAFFHANVLATLAYTPFPYLLTGEPELQFPVLIPPIKLPFQLPFMNKEPVGNSEKGMTNTEAFESWTEQLVSLSNIVSIRRILCALLEPTLPGVMDHVLAFQEFLQLIVKTSLSPVETFLLATLLVNLFYFASFNTVASSWHDPSFSLSPTAISVSNDNNIPSKFPQLPNSIQSSLAVAAAPAVVLKAVIFGACVVSVYPILSIVSKIINIEKYKTSRPLSVADKAKATSKQLLYARNALAVYLPGMILVTFWLFMFTDLPNWYIFEPGSSAVLKSLSFIISPIHFIFYYVIFPSEEVAYAHLKITGYWLAVLAVVVPFVQIQSDSWSHIDLRRKVWHITVVVMFLPVGLPGHPTFTKLCMAAATFIFLAIEFARVTTIPPIGPAVHSSLLKYLDPRDTCGPIIVSHIFLLVGISVPMYLCNSPAGIICLGLGDAAASVLGRRYGRTRWPWPNNNKKTVQGTVAFIGAAVFGMALYKWVILKFGYPEQYKQPYVLDTYNPFASYSDAENINGFLSGQLAEKGLTLTKMVIVATMTALLEAFSSMNDNVIVPLYMTALLQLC